MIGTISSFGASHGQAEHSSCAVQCPALQRENPVLMRRLPLTDGTPRDSGVKSGGAGLAACLSAATGVSRAPSISPACAGSVRSTGRGGPSFRSAALFWPTKIQPDLAK